MVKAFADDVGLVIRNVEHSLPVLVRTLKVFSEISGMHINLPKTVGIPLWTEEVGDVKARVAEVAPAWAGLPLADHATYLGCEVGPGKVGKERSRAAKRFKQKIAGWDWASLGLHFTATVYNTYLLSSILFPAQIARVSKEVLELETWALRKAAPGPGNWCSNEDLWGSKAASGYAAIFWLPGHYR